VDVGRRLDAATPRENVPKEMRSRPPSAPHVRQDRLGRGPAHPERQSVARRERADAVIAGRAAMYRDKAADRDEVAATAHVMRPAGRGVRRRARRLSGAGQVTRWRRPPRQQTSVPLPRENLATATETTSGSRPTSYRRTTEQSSQPARFVVSRGLRLPVKADRLHPLIPRETPRFTPSTAAAPPSSASSDGSSTSGRCQRSVIGVPSGSGCTPT